MIALRKRACTSLLFYTHIAAGPVRSRSRPLFYCGFSGVLLYTTRACVRTRTWSLRRCLSAGPLVRRPCYIHDSCYKSEILRVYSAVSVRERERERERLNARVRTRMHYSSSFLRRIERNHDNVLVGLPKKFSSTL